MKCADHAYQDAVAQCGDCLKGLCSDCASVFTPPVCCGCATTHNQSVARSLYMALGLMAVLFIGAAIVLLPRAPFGTALLYSLMAGFFPAGWSFLGRYLPPSGSYLSPLARWLNLAAHAGLAASLGFILGPIQLYKAWKEFNTIKSTKEMLSK